jgi:DNA modification methylase
MQPSGARFRTLQPSCTCNASWRPGLVLDPFFGSGTVGVVAERQRRAWVGIELNPAFARLAERRIVSARPNQAPEAGAAGEKERRAA